VERPRVFRISSALAVHILFPSQLISYFSVFRLAPDAPPYLCKLYLLRLLLPSTYPTSNNYLKTTVSCQSPRTLTHRFSCGPHPLFYPLCRSRNDPPTIPHFRRGPPPPDTCQHQPPGDRPSPAAPAPPTPGSRILPRSRSSAATPSSPDTRPRSTTVDAHAASLSSPPRIARRRRVPFGEDILPVLGDRIAPVGVAEQHPIPRARPGGAVPEPVLPGHQPGGVVVFRDLCGRFAIAISASFPLFRSSLCDGPKVTLNAAGESAYP